MKYLYVNGDSYTYGMDDKKFGTPIQNRWSTLVAYEFNLVEVNDSENGSKFDLLSNAYKSLASFL